MHALSTISLQHSVAFVLHTAFLSYSAMLNSHISSEIKVHHDILQ